MFSKEERSSFKYWFAHWCAYQMTALNLKCWKFRHLFHDAEKPWMKLIFSYPTVQQFHRNHNKHHMAYYLKYGKCNWLDMAIDWECSRFTKTSSPRTCREELERYLSIHKDELTNKQYTEIKTNITQICDRLGI